MRRYLFCEAGFVEKPHWIPNCWVNVENPTQDDFNFLEKDLKVPSAFLNDIADNDERPRIDMEGNWLLTILRIPIFEKDNNISYTTVPIGIITNNEIIVSAISWNVFAYNESGFLITAGTPSSEDSEI